MAEQNSKTYELNISYLKAYYDRLFPFEPIYNWLSKNCEKTFPNREFALIKEDGTYMRYLSFNGFRELKSAVLKKMPIRIEIGAIYNQNPKDRDAALDFKALQKELIFDIDISDYNDIRTCCKENAICSKCWPLMSCAVKVIESALRDDFGFKNIFWTFSGRRGIHCWISDDRAKNLSDKERFAISNYLSVLNSSAFDRKKALSNAHFSLKRAVHFCRYYFLKLAESQKWMDSMEGVERILGSLTTEFLDLKALLRKSWLEENADRSAEFKFGQLEDYLRDGKNFVGVRKWNQKKLMASIWEIILVHTYPRLDIEVTRKANHLLKSPFVVHPGTGLVCVPIITRDSYKEDYNAFNDRKEKVWQVDFFDLDNVPSLVDLHKSLNEETAKSSARRIFDKSVEYFEETLKTFK